VFLERIGKHGLERIISLGEKDDKAWLESMEKAGWKG
jgi:hypothetical protein